MTSLGLLRPSAIVLFCNVPCRHTCAVADEAIPRRADAEAADVDLQRELQTNESHAAGLASLACTTAAAQQAAAQAAVTAALAGFEAVVHGRSLATPAAQAHRGG